MTAVGAALNFLDDGLDALDALDALKTVFMAFVDVAAFGGGTFILF